ncbi:hypothetical protein [Novosphingobium beihaiensis]|uniref:Uncharacterized protein n=1 Tax=Novosphingobium beihaiensis TaxID=2930389 RepID=A0ABT0BTS8_9SPHN|nr:hypothetical protein [Novosphingobium beihaiensis]MCJ2188385.1 hypothetical protein [Novosphingobium beihaiensis]
MRMDCLNTLHPQLNYSDFAPVSRQLLISYAQLADRGVPVQAIAAAMLGATLNFYDAFGLSHELPDLLRSMAELLERGNLHS